MKHIIILLLTMSSFLAKAQEFQTSIPDDYGYKVKLGQTMPDFTLELPDGTKTTMKELRGKVVMLQFTASWCSVCRKEMPHIQKDIWEKHKSNPHFALYGIDLKEDAEATLTFQKRMGITYPLALDLEGDIFAMFTQKNAGVTRNIIVDKTGEIVFMTRLFKAYEYKKMKEVIDILLADI